jgi:hypothetical protein
LLPLCKGGAKAPHSKAPDGAYIAFSDVCDSMSFVVVRVAFGRYEIASRGRMAARLLIRHLGGWYTPVGGRKQQVTQDSLFNLADFPGQGFCQAATSESGSCVTKLPRAGLKSAPTNDPSPAPASRGTLSPRRGQAKSKLTLPSPLWGRGAGGEGVSDR